MFASKWWQLRTRVVWLLSTGVVWWYLLTMTGLFHAYRTYIYIQFERNACRQLNVLVSVVVFLVAVVVVVV